MSIDSRFLRNALGQFATGVCVVTTEGKDVPAFGMTINSFAALSLEPPLVMWSIEKNSDCYSDFEKVTSYSVNVLTEDQKHLANRYAKRGEHALVENDYCEGKLGGPVLSDSLAKFECDIDQRVDGGDHTILIGRVKHVEYQEGGRPILFFSGDYCTL